VRWLPALALALALVGVFLRLTNLDTRVFWHDEAFTAMAMAGYSRNALSREFDGSELTPADLMRYQSVRPDWTAVQTIRSLAAEETQITPLYFALARGWVAVLGQSIATMRAWSALWSMLSLPLVYLLALDLFGSSLVAWTALGLMAVSPYYYYYAHEAREYSLWSFVTLLACLALRQAMQRDTRRWWAVYGVSVALGLYTHAFFTFVAAAHGLTVALGEAGPNWRTWHAHPMVRRFVGAILLGGALFLPWALAILLNLRRVFGNTRWTFEGNGWSAYLQSSLMGWERVLLDDGERLPGAVNALLAVFVVALIVYALWFVVRHAPRHAALLVLTLVLVPSAMLLAPDLVFGGRKFTVIRYLTPVFLGVQLALAYCLATAMTHAPRFRWWQGLTAALLVGGLISCLSLAPLETVHMGGTTGSNVAIARLLNGLSQPLLVSDVDETNFYNLLALSHRFDPHVRLRVISNPNQLVIPTERDQVYALNPVAATRAELATQGYRLENAVDGVLFRVIR
jgi:uncharacterized membrane protein